ncbi:MAG: hypothetical protein D6737_13240 [Chloroflexi bacterium]|nr:MAG: hypothetical protein CUN54_04750 [Phototrophicales bacterium]RMF78905.1 MAG: hypothetical protein D6737_13240 [Chloroflexota bacterium]
MNIDNIDDVLEARFKRIKSKRLAFDFVSPHDLLTTSNRIRTFQPDAGRGYQMTTEIYCTGKPAMCEYLMERKSTSRWMLFEYQPILTGYLGERDDGSTRVLGRAYMAWYTHIINFVGEVGLGIGLIVLGTTVIRDDTLGSLIIAGGVASIIFFVLKLIAFLPGRERQMVRQLYQALDVAAYEAQHQTSTLNSGDDLHPVTIGFASPRMRFVSPNSFETCIELLEHNPKLRVRLERIDDVTCHFTASFKGFWQIVSYSGYFKRLAVNPNDIALKADKQTSLEQTGIVAEATTTGSWFIAAYFILGIVALAVIFSRFSREGNDGFALGVGAVIFLPYMFMMMYSGRRLEIHLWRTLTHFVPSINTDKSST